MYRKVKYKDDEFKKLNVNKFVKTFIVAFLFGVAAILETFFLTIRVTTFNNAENFANPIDVLVIVIGLVTFLLLCYFIRKYYISFKENLEKRRREKLKLNEKQEDTSGTIALNHTETQEVVQLEKQKQILNYQIYPNLYVNISDVKLYRLYKKQVDMLSDIFDEDPTEKQIFELLNYGIPYKGSDKELAKVLKRLKLKKPVQITDFATVIDLYS